MKEEKYIYIRTNTETQEEMDVIRHFFRVPVKITVVIEARPRMSVRHSVQSQGSRNRWGARVDQGKCLALLAIFAVLLDAQKTHVSQGLRLILKDKSRN